MHTGAILLKGLDRQQRIKAALLSSWFFVTIVTLWLLKPLRVASLLAHLGAVETPYVRLAGVAVVALVVMFYSAVVNRLSRASLVRWSNGVFAAILMLFWGAPRRGRVAWRADGRSCGPSISSSRSTPS